MRVRDDGQGIDAAVLANQGLEGHYGLRGTPERAALIGGKLAVWSEVGAGRGGVAPSGPHRLRDIREALLVVTAVGLQDAGTRRRGRVMSSPIQILGVLAFPHEQERCDNTRFSELWAST